MKAAKQLHQVTSGRVFVRAAANARPEGYQHAQGQVERYKGALLLAGVIEVPASVELEVMHSVRVNSRLWLDATETRLPHTHMSADAIAECDLSHLLTNFQFAAGALRDSAEVFVRGTLLEHERTDMRWVFIAGVVAQRLDALPNEGLYEFDASKQGFQLLSTDTFRGETPTGFLRKPLWGPGGDWGFATTMEPERFPAWLATERSKAPGSHEDPKFRAFVALMEERCPAKYAYTRGQHAQRESMSRAVVEELLAVEGAIVTSSAAAPSLQRRARP